MTPHVDVKDSIQPIVCGEPPPHTSKESQSRRLFADGRVDRNGLLRRLPSPEDPGNAYHNSSSDSESSDVDDSGGAPGALKRQVAQLFESGSDEEQTRREVKRAKVKADVFRPVPVLIPTTPIKAKPIAEPPDWSKYIVSSDSESGATPRPAQRSKPRPRPQNKRALSIADNTPAGPDVKGKGKARAESVEVSNFICFAMLFNRNMLIFKLIEEANEPMAAGSVKDIPNTRIRPPTTQPRAGSETQLAAPKSRDRSHSPAGHRPTTLTNDSKRDHPPNRSDNDRKRPRTDSRSKTRPDGDRQRSGSHDRAAVATEGGRYIGYPAGRRHNRQFLHPSQSLGYDYQGRDSRWSDGPDSRGRYNPRDGRWYRPPRHEYFPPEGWRERAGRQYLHPDDYTYGRGESGMADEYAGDEYAGDEYAGDEYAGDEYAGDEYADDEYADDEYHGPPY